MVVEQIKDGIVKESEGKEELDKVSVEDIMANDSLSDRVRTDLLLQVLAECHKIRSLLDPKFRE